MGRRRRRRGRDEGRGGKKCAEHAEAIAASDAKHDGKVLESVSGCQSGSPLVVGAELADGVPLKEAAHDHGGPSSSERP